MGMKVCMAPHPSLLASGGEGEGDFRINDKITIQRVRYSSKNLIVGPRQAGRDCLDARSEDRTSQKVLQ